MGNIDHLFYQLVLHRCARLGARSARKLIDICGSLEAVFQAEKESLCCLQGFHPEIYESLHSDVIHKEIEKEIAFMENNDIKCIFFDQDDFPQRLHHCNDAPLLLFKKGSADLNQKKMLAVVGTRRASHYGKEQTKQIISELQQDDICVISGLAHGIDTYAHLAALDAQIPTICVLGHGLEQIYPSENKDLAKRMLQADGACLSEFPFGTPSLPHHFPRRNRIVAGMCDAVLVVESGVKGGAMITAKIAESYNREVFAVPGRNGDKFSQGCNYLIKENKAVLVESANDIRDYMRWELYENPVVKNKVFVRTQLDFDQSQIIESLRLENPISLEVLCKRLNRKVQQVYGPLFSLEMANLIEGLPGNIYRLRT